MNDIKKIDEFIQSLNKLDIIQKPKNKDAMLELKEAIVTLDRMKHDLAKYSEKVIDEKLATIFLAIHDKLWTKYNIEIAHDRNNSDLVFFGQHRIKPLDSYPSTVKKSPRRKR